MENLKRVLKKELGFTYANVLIKNSKNDFITLKNILRNEFGITYANYIFRVAKNF